MAFIVIWVASLIFWAAVSVLTGAQEPWDAASFWPIVYPAALVLSMVLGSTLKSYPWSAGAIVMFAQIPVMVASSGLSPLLGVGFIYAAILSIPAILLSWIAGRIRRHDSGK